MPIITCVQCGTEKDVERATARFCSGACKVKAHRGKPAVTPAVTNPAVTPAPAVTSLPLQSAVTQSLTDAYGRPRKPKTPGCEYCEYRGFACLRCDPVKHDADCPCERCHPPKK